MNEVRKIFLYIVLCVLLVLVAYIGGCLYGHKQNNSGSIGELESNNRALRSELERQGNINQSLNAEIRNLQSTQQQTIEITESGIAANEEQRTAIRESKELVDRIRAIQTSDRSDLDKLREYNRVIEKAVTGGKGYNLGD
jgi:hypothetical protein